MLTNKTYNYFVFYLSGMFVELLGNSWWHSLIHEKNIAKSNFYLSFLNNKKDKYRFALVKCTFKAVKKLLQILYMRCLFSNKTDLSKYKNVVVKYFSTHLDFIDSNVLSILIPQRSDYKEVKQKKLICIYSFINPIDFFIVVYKYFCVLLRLAVYSPELRYLITQYSTEFFGSDAFPFLKKDFYISFVGDVLIEGLFYEKIFTNIRRESKAVKKLVYVHEGLAWEKALCEVFKTSEAEVIGLVCSAVHSNVTSFFCSSFEKNMPKPNRLGVLGELQKKQFEKCYSNVFIYGSGRYNNLKSIVDNSCNSSIKKDKGILISLSFDNKVNEATLKFIYAALSHNYRIRMTMHPKGTPSQQMLKYYQLDRRSVEEIMQDYNVVICCGDTSFAFTAYAYGKIIVSLNVKGQLELNPLAEFCREDLVITKTPDELRNYINRLYKYGYSTLYNFGCNKLKRRRQQFLNKYFDFVSKEEMIKRIFYERKSDCLS